MTLAAAADGVRMLVCPSSQRTRTRGGSSPSTSSITPVRLGCATFSDSTTILSPTWSAIVFSPSSSDLLALGEASASYPAERSPLDDDRRGTSRPGQRGSRRGWRSMQRKPLKIEPVTVSIDTSLEGIDWAQAKADLAADDFDNGRTPEALRRSFEQSEHVVFARDGECNAYLLDVWTASAYRRRGIGSAMIDRLLECVPGQHVGLQTAADANAFYESLSFRPQPEFWSTIVGSWLENDANRA